MEEKGTILHKTKEDGNGGRHLPRLTLGGICCKITKISAQEEHTLNDVWNLDPLYRGFEDHAFETDLNELKKKVAQFEAFTGNLQNA